MLKYVPTANEQVSVFSNHRLLQCNFRLLECISM